jgi:hypothetical protein
VIAYPFLGPTPGPKLIPAPSAPADLAAMTEADRERAVHSCQIEVEAEANRLKAEAAEADREGAELGHQLGVCIQEVTDEIAESVNISPPRGVLVAGVDPGGPAKSAGIERGDVVVSFDGQDRHPIHHGGGRQLNSDRHGRHRWRSCSERPDPTGIVAKGAAIP